MPETTVVSYHTKIARQRTERLRALTKELPPSCEDFSAALSLPQRF